MLFVSSLSTLNSPHCTYLSAAIMANKDIYVVDWILALSAVYLTSAQSVSDFGN